MGTRFIKIATIYLAIGVSLGLGMGLTSKFTLMPVHAHVNLLGWASLALCGLIYHLYPAAASTRLAKLHFWMHNLGLPPLMVALALLVSGNEAAGPVVGITSMVVAVAVLLFVINVWLVVKPETASLGVAGAAIRATAR